LRTGARSASAPETWRCITSGNSPTLASSARRAGPRGRRSWREGAASHLWSAWTATPVSTPESQRRKIAD
jgi:hypothetical protein